MQNVLAPVDFSADSLHALQHACELARPFRARLHLVHVVESSVLVPPAVGTSSTQVPPERFLREAEVRLEELVAQWALETATIEVCVGDAAERIVACGRDRGVDLIVMGTHGARSSSRRLMGRTAEKVVRLAESPVLTVPCRHRESGDDAGEPLDDQACFGGGAQAATETVLRG